MSATPYKSFTGTATDFYVAAPATATLVNLAVRLGRPILVEGEAGCGKTRLASAIATELGVGLTVMTVKSTSQAKDLLYRFDALRRLQDAQIPGNTTARHVHPYLSLEPLGHAIQSGTPQVVLIDEVDKADIDFPNDLLDVLDRFEFDLEDLPRDEEDACRAARGVGRHVSAPKDGTRPIVLITSNREKQLPEPFLRRCLYLQLDFPEDQPERLADIVRKNLAPRGESVGDTLLAAAVARFCEIRAQGRRQGVRKLPATSELVDWVRTLHWQGRKEDSLDPKALDALDTAVLFKLRADIDAYKAGKDEDGGGW